MVRDLQADLNAFTKLMDESNPELAGE